MITRFLNWMSPKKPLPDVTGKTLMEASDAMQGCPFYETAYVLIKQMISIVERHEAEIKELKEKNDSNHTST